MKFLDFFYKLTHVPKWKIKGYMLAENLHYKGLALKIDSHTFLFEKISKLTVIKKKRVPEDIWVTFVWVGGGHVFFLRTEHHSENTRLTKKTQHPCI